MHRERLPDRDDVLRPLGGTDRTLISSDGAMEPADDADDAVEGASAASGSVKRKLDEMMNGRAAANGGGDVDVANGAQYLNGTASEAAAASSSSAVTVGGARPKVRRPPLTSVGGRTSPPAATTSSPPASSPSSCRRPLVIASTSTGRPTSPSPLSSRSSSPAPNGDQIVPSDLGSDTNDDGANFYVYKYKGGYGGKRADLPKSFYQLEDAGSDTSETGGVGPPTGVSAAGESNLSTEVAALIQSEMASKKELLQQQVGFGDTFDK